MTRADTRPDEDLAKRFLEDLWQEVLDEDTPPPVDPRIARLVTCNLVSVRYALPTQLLGKLTDNGLDALSLQTKDSTTTNSWNPRSFTRKTIVPWVDRNNHVLGTSSEPYASKPLRRPRLERSPEDVRDPDLWATLYDVLKEVEDKSDPDFTHDRLKQTLFAIKEELRRQDFEYAVPLRVSQEATIDLVSTFLSEGSGGARGLSIAAALFETIGRLHGIYTEVKRHVVNASDESTGTAGDVECFDAQGSLALAIEVKERDLTSIDVKHSIQKARAHDVSEYLFIAPGVPQDELEEIHELFSSAWASGTNLYRLSLEDLLSALLPLLGEEGRITFLRAVGDQLDRYNIQPNDRRRWQELLESL